MSERWPASMSFADACAYLGVSVNKGRQILDRIPTLQHDTGDPRADARSDRYWSRKTLDLYIEKREQTVVGSRKAA